ncbi:hypothetical protein GCM10023225_05800 [Kineococcus glutinatus]|uniref:GT2 family glycosyltransferase n=1 Tax=Kineococcus glutinatus TaxID=1070872 RepID=A0ABP9HAJ3_9ACTN
MFNRVDMTLPCLVALADNTPRELFELVVVDNASQDETQAVLGQLAGDVTVITNSANLGFAVACNQGAAAARGEVVVFLNNDVEVAKGWLEPLLGVLDQDPSVGAVGSLLLYPDGRVQHAGVLLAELSSCPLGPIHLHYGGSPDSADVLTRRPYPAVTGALVAVRRAAFEQVGGFDEDYWNGYEDVDLCLALAERGWGVVYEPASVAVHHESQSGPERHVKEDENLRRFVRRWLPRVVPDLLAGPGGGLHPARSSAAAASRWRAGVAEVWKGEPEPVRPGGQAPPAPPRPATPPPAVGRGPSPVAVTDPADLTTHEHAREDAEAVEERRLLDVVRAGRDVCWIEPEDEPDPLVTIRIATFNRGPLVAERAIASALEQTYRNIEVLVVGDACDEATERAVLSVADPRVRFVNLGHRGIYPQDRMAHWRVAGSTPANVALHLARGAWIAPCDDDDELTPDHVEVLLRHAQRHRLEMVWSRASWEAEPGLWVEVGSEPLQEGHISHGSVLYSLGLRFFPYNGAAWKLPEPADWNLWRRMQAAGVRTGFLDQVTYVHYLEAYKRPLSPAPVVRRDEVRLHLGCGTNKLPGWINIDIDPQYQPDLVHDLSLGIPAQDGSVDFIHSEHVFEHLSLEAGIRLMRECRRVLRPGGVVRIAMPDLKYVAERYLDRWRDQAWLRDPGFDWIDTPCRMLNVAMREWGHTYVYDADELRLRLQQSGFTTVRECGRGRSDHPQLQDLETREDSLLVFEAVAT